VTADRFACALCRHPPVAARPHCPAHGKAFEKLLTAALKLRRREDIDGLGALAMAVWPSETVVDALLQAVTSGDRLEDEHGQLLIEVAA
jgi:hypothetical protein